MIEISQVEKIYKTGKESVYAVKPTNLTIEEGDILGIVGESGSGKSTLGKMIIGLEFPTRGTISYNGTPLWIKNKYRRINAGEIQTVFQDPQSSLDPRMRVKDIILEPLLALPKLERISRRNPERLLELIKRVGLKEEHLNRFPHEFSGGQRQRIAIARALITNPKFIIFDEPTSALDVSVQAQVLNLLKELQKERKLTYLFISHNMSVIRYMCKKVAVMYKGELVEVGDTETIFKSPQHPYTQKLLSSVLGIQEIFDGEKQKLQL